MESENWAAPHYVDTITTLFLPKFAGFDLDKAR